MSTYYAVLGIAPDATPAEVRAAYIRAARRHHPDRQGGAGGSAESVHSSGGADMRSINAAWAVLGDQTQRDAYDRSIGVGVAPAPENSSREFTPYAVDDEDDDDAWRYEPDPPNPEATPPRLVVAAPPVLAAVGIALVVLSIPIGIRLLLAAGVICLALSALCFIGAPLFAMIQGQGAERQVEQRRRRSG